MEKFSTRQGLPGHSDILIIRTGPSKLEQLPVHPQRYQQAHSQYQLDLRGEAASDTKSNQISKRAAYDDNLQDTSEGKAETKDGAQQSGIQEQIEPGKVLSPKEIKAIPEEDSDSSGDTKMKTMCHQLRKGPRRDEIVVTYLATTTPARPERDKNIEQRTVCRKEGSRSSWIS